MKVIHRFQELVASLSATSGRLEKEALLAQYVDDTEVKAILNFVYNPYVITGISTKKINKFKAKIVYSIFDINQQYDYNNVLDMLDYIKKNNHGRDDDLIMVERFAQAHGDYRDLIYAIATKSLKLGVQPITLNKIFGEGFIPSFDVMLAQKYFDDPEKLVPEGTEFILTTKLDGVRCILLNKESGPEFYSRQGQRFDNLVELEAEALALPKGFAYDGELLLDLQGLDSKDLYRETMKVVSADKEKRNVTFNCFDAVTIEDFEKGFYDKPCRLRKAFVSNILSEPDTPHIREVKRLYVGTDKSMIDYWLDAITTAGGEGVMINIADAPYECKRSKYLLKVKKFQTADVEVYDLEEGTGQNAGRLGALKVHFIGPDNKTYSCDVGSGLTQDQRIDFWNNPDKVLGKIIEIGYFEITSNQLGGYGLRFPTFKWIREDKDQISMF